MDFVVGSIIITLGLSLAGTIGLHIKLYKDMLDLTTDTLQYRADVCDIIERVDKLEDFITAPPKGVPSNEQLADKLKQMGILNEVIPDPYGGVL